LKTDRTGKAKKKPAQTKVCAGNLPAD